MSRPKKFRTETEKAITISEEFTGLKRDSIFKRNSPTTFSRQRERVIARAYVYLILRHFYKWTYQAIADEFDLDHGTVLHSLRTLNNYYEHDGYYRVQITHMLQKAVKSLGVKSA